MFSILRTGLIELVREKSTLFFTLLFPVILVFILGNMLANLDNPEDTIDTIRLAYAVETAGETERAAVRTFLDELSKNDNIELIPIAGDQFADARAAAESGDYAAAMLFGEPLAVTIAEGRDMVKNRAVKLMAQGFSLEYAAISTAARENPQRLEHLEDVLAKSEQMAADIDPGIQRSMIDYYAVTMIIMICFMGGGIGGAMNMFTAKQSGALRRVTASPKRGPVIFLEYVASAIPQSILQVVVVMIPSVLFFGAHYAKTWQQSLLAGLFLVLLGLTVAAVFMLVGLFLKSSPYLPLMAAFWVILFLSGTFSKAINIKGVSEYMPTSLAQQAVFDLTVFGRSGMILTGLGVCVLILAAACLAGALLFRRKEIMF